MSHSLRSWRRRKADTPMGVVSVFVSLMAWAMLVQAAANHHLHARYHQTETEVHAGSGIPGTSGSWSDPVFGLKYGHDEHGCPFNAQLVNPTAESAQVAVADHPIPLSVIVVAYVAMLGSDAPLEASARAPPLPV